MLSLIFKDFQLKDFQLKDFQLEDLLLRIFKQYLKHKHEVVL